MPKGNITSWIWRGQVRGVEAVKETREVTVTLEVPSNETHDFIPRLMTWLQSDVNDEKSVTLLVTGKGEKRGKLFAFSNMGAAYEAGEGYRKQDPLCWYEVENLGIWDGWEGIMPVHTDEEGKRLSLDPVKEINPKGE
jgi:hypothetical protein